MAGAGGCNPIPQSRRQANRQMGFPAALGCALLALRPLENPMSEGARLLRPDRAELRWDSIDLDEARHPQTLLAWGMNGADLPIPFGGPLRMRVPRQLGYKSVKYINRLIVTDSLKGFGAGKGSADAEDGYAWYAGI